MVDYLSPLIKHTLYRTQYDNPVLVENVHDIVMTSNKSLSFIHFFMAQNKDIYWKDGKILTHNRYQTLNNTIFFQNDCNRIVYCRHVIFNFIVLIADL